MTEVTQADREAAVAWMKLDGHAWSDIYMQVTLEGRGDDGQLVQAFAAHREAAELRAARLVEEQIVAWLRAGYPGWLPMKQCEQLAYVIERGDHKGETEA